MDHKALKDKKSPIIARKANWVNSLAFHDNYPLKAFSRLAFPSLNQGAVAEMHIPWSSANPVAETVAQHLQASPVPSAVQVFKTVVISVNPHAVSLGSEHD